jgi:hypothetical protein
MVRQGRTRAAGRRRGLVAVVAVLGLGIAACSDDSSGARSAPRRSTTTSTSIVVGSKVIGGGTVLDNEAQTFPVDNGKARVLVPIGAVPKGTEVIVREVTGAPADLGAIQRAGGAYDLSFKNGKLNAGKKIAIEFPTTGSSGTDASDARPIGGVWDDGDGVWRTTEDDPGSGTITVYASKAGKYTWLRWNRDRAVQAGAATIRSLVGPATPATVGARCTDTDAVRTRFDLSTNVGSALSWCVGRVDGRDALRVLNTGQAPLTIRYKNFDPPRVVHANALTGRLYDALVPYWTPQDGEQVAILGPADEAAFTVTDGGSKGMLRAELNGFTQHFDAVSAAIAFTTGYYAGNASLAASLLEGNVKLRTALVERLASQGCANGLGDKVTGGSYATDKLAEYAALLVERCVDDATAKLVLTEARATAQGALLSKYETSIPARSKQQVDPALRAALSPLVEAVGGPVAGEIIMTPRLGGSSSGGSGGSGGGDAFSPTGTAPAGAVTVAPPAATTTLPSLFNTTTVETAPPSATTTAAPAPTTSATTTTVAATTTTRATTTTTRAPATTTTRAPTTTTSTTVAPTTTTTTPVTPLVFSIVNAPCASTGGTLTATSGNFAPGSWAASFWSPSNAFTTSSGTVNANGTISWTFPCAGKEPGRWKVQVSQGTRQTPVLEFVVRVYDTMAAAAVDVGICSGSEGGAGASGAPGGTLRQTFVVYGTSVSRITIANREEFVGTLTVRRGSATGPLLFTTPVTGAGGPSIVVPVSGVTTTSPEQLGTLVLELTATNSTAASPNKALNFWRSAADVAAGVGLSVANPCPWPVGGPAVEAGTDLIAMIEA